MPRAKDLLQAVRGAVVQLAARIDLREPRQKVDDLAEVVWRPSEAFERPQEVRMCRARSEHCARAFAIAEHRGKHWRLPRKSLPQCVEECVRRSFCEQR